MYAGFFADVPVSFSVVFIKILPQSLSVSSLSLSISTSIPIPTPSLSPSPSSSLSVSLSLPRSSPVFGKEWVWFHKKQVFCGCYRGNMCVPGENLFIFFHMDGAWWGWLNVPWVWGVVRLYGIFYYVMGKKVCHYSEAPMTSTILPETPFMKKSKLFSSKRGWEGGGNKGELNQGELFPRKILFFHKSLQLECSDFCQEACLLQQGKNSENICFNCFFPF